MIKISIIEEGDDISVVINGETVECSRNEDGDLVFAADIRDDWRELVEAAVNFNDNNGLLCAAL